MLSSRHTFAAVLIGLSGLPTLQSPLYAQLTLRGALARADRSAYANRIAAGSADAAAAQTIAPLAGILPSARLEAGFVRTTDPVAVFGTRLRQRSITAADFDPQRLTSPAALDNYQGAAILEQPILNLDAWAGRTAARHGASAARASATWTRLSTRVDVIRAYYGLVLASERATTLAAAARAAHAHVAEAEATVRQGMATRSDALLAAVRAGDVDAQLADATGGVTIARERLAVLLGTAPSVLDGVAGIPAVLPPSDRLRAIVAADTMPMPPEPRADVAAAREGSAAASADVARARAAYVPRINTFARSDWNGRTRIDPADRNWTVGVMASWTPFGGARELSALHVAEGQAAAARAQADAATANAALDASESRTTLAVALTRLSIAERAASQSTEAHRIVSRKYAGGLATVVELLDAQATETQSALALSAARYDTIVAAAERLRALGRDPAALAVLDDAGQPTTP